MTKNLGGGAPGEGKCNALAARLRMNAATEIRVVAQEYSGRCYLHIRQYFLGDDNEFRPTQKGVSLSIDKLGEVLDAVRDLREAGNSPSTAAVVEKSAREEVRFSVVTWEGMTKADIRSYFSKDGMNERQPGKGVRLNLALLVDLERGLEALDRELNG